MTRTMLRKIFTMARRARWAPLAAVLGLLPLLATTGCMRQRYQTALLQQESRFFEDQLNRATYELQSCRERNAALRAALAEAVGDGEPMPAMIGSPGGGGASIGLPGGPAGARIVSPSVEIVPEAERATGRAQPLEFQLAPPALDPSPRTSPSPSDAPLWSPEPSLPGTDPGYWPRESPPAALPEPGNSSRGPSARRAPEPTYRTDSTAGPVVVPASHDGASSDAGWTAAPGSSSGDVRTARRPAVPSADFPAPVRVSDLFNEATPIPATLRPSIDSNAPVIAPEWSPEPARP